MIQSRWSNELVFEKLLIANRGEIALRVMRACRDLKIPSVAIYAHGEQHAPHVRYADEAYRLISDAPIPYLDIEAILAVAHQSGSRAVHPGYGFLAENAEFARACTEAGVIFVGPPAEAISAMGDKIRARELARNASVPLVPGSDDAVEPDSVTRLAQEIGYPVALKAAAGGGGRGFRVAYDESELDDALSGATGEAERYFGDSRVFIERYLESPRHVEIQILADQHGTIIPLRERDCSVQRRHQKLIEEAPSPVLSDTIRTQMEFASVELARAVDYVSAGTVEFLVQDDEFFFLEMNTRIQVEHPVTELITGVDLVAMQIRIAAGEDMSATVASERTGHAIECRINAEDPANGFQPASGTIDASVIPQGPGVRLDGIIEPGASVSPQYDSLLGKLVTWGADRDEAIRRMQRALSELQIAGVPTTTSFHQAVMAHPVFREGNYDTRFLERYPEVLDVHASETKITSDPGSTNTNLQGEEVQVEVNGRRFDVRVYRENKSTNRRTPPRLSESRGAASIAPDGSETIFSPIQGTVLSVAVDEGAMVRAGDVICVIEAMKMENEISAGRDGTVSKVEVAAGRAIESGALIAIIESGEGAADN
jgi:acetyl-CoA/propionyl-CoA carboxylase, biotin carboxylase, biotin carboxyl carrier protein